MARSPSRNKHKELNPSWAQERSQGCRLRYRCALCRRHNWGLECIIHLCRKYCGDGRSLSQYEYGGEEMPAYISHLVTSSSLLVSFSDWLLRHSQHWGVQHQHTGSESLSVTLPFPNDGHQRRYFLLDYRTSLREGSGNRNQDDNVGRDSRHLTTSSSRLNLSITFLGPFAASSPPPTDLGVPSLVLQCPHSILLLWHSLCWVIVFVTLVCPIDSLQFEGRDFCLVHPYPQYLIQSRCSISVCGLTVLLIPQCIFFLQIRIRSIPGFQMYWLKEIPLLNLMRYLNICPIM